jgi:adenylyl-sulfate kinase
MKIFTMWMTGLSGAGKSTLAQELCNGNTVVLDGDVVRTGLCKDLGFSDADRAENIRRIAEVAKLMNLAGLNVIVACISPFAADRAKAKTIIGADNFIELYLSASLETCEKRDVKGLYAKVRSGNLSNFTGISAPYEAPLHADITIDTANYTINDAVSVVREFISKQ